MRKEVIFAVILGLLLGGIIIYGIYLSNQSVQQLTKAKQLDQSELTAESPTPTPGNNKLVITSPLDNSVSFESKLTLTGVASPSSTVALVSESDDILLTADEMGKFEHEVNLIGGENQIQVSIPGADDNLETIEITVIYTTAKVE